SNRARPDLANKVSEPFVANTQLLESARWPSVVPLRVGVVGVAVLASVIAAATVIASAAVVATAPLGLATIVTGGFLPSVAGFRIPRDLVLATRGNTGQHDLGILQANLLHQRKKRRGILGRDTHAAVRGRPAEISHLKAAVDRIAILPEENGMRHGRVVPLLAVPDFIHGGGRIGP